MNTIQAIKERRSIRKFQSKMVPREIVEKILDASINAPSGKNRQPWRFIVLEGKKKAELVDKMIKSINIDKKQGKDMGSCDISINVINEAPVVILVFNPFSRVEEDYNYSRLLVDTQSIGASIQTMILAAQELGVGSLWICDTFYCNDEICDWLDCNHELMAAVALGYADQSPNPRPRKPWEEVTEWMS